MPNREREKGRKGEAAVRAIFEAHGFTVRGLEGKGDHTIFRAYPLGDGKVSVPYVVHSEVKRQETARPWAWMAQAEAEAPDGSVPVVSFRRSRSDWYSIIRTVDLARLLA